MTSIHKVGHSRFAKTVIARSLNKDTFTCSNGKKGSLSALLAKGKLLALMPGQIYAHYPHTPSDNSKVYFYDEVIIRLQ